MFFLFFLECQLGPFTPVTTCTKTCGSGTQELNRTCYNIADSTTSVPQLCSNTSLCDEYSIETGACNTQVCISKY